MGYYEQNSKSELPPVKLNQLRWNSSCVLLSKQTHIRKNQYTRVNQSQWNRFDGWGLKDNYFMEKLINEIDGIIRFPKKTIDKKKVIQWLSTKFELDKEYSEKEVNKIIE